MARVLQTGFEHGSPLWFDAVSGATITAGSKRNGNYGLNLGQNHYGQKALPSPLGEFYFRVGFNVVNATFVMIQFREDATLHVEVRLNNNGAIAVYRGATLLASAGVYPGATYHCVEGRIKIHDATGIAHIKVDGDLVIELNNVDTRNGGTTGEADNLRLVGGTVGGSIMYADDLALNDTTGARNNSWVGNGRAALMVPNAAGDKTDLTPSADANWQNVDEVPHDSDTTYNQSATVGHYDLYNLTSVTLESGEAINAVAALAVVKLAAAGDGDAQVGIKTAAEDWATAVPLGSDAYVMLDKIYEVDPHDSAAWSQAKLDALQVGVKVA